MSKPWGRLCKFLCASQKVGTLMWMKILENVGMIPIKIWFVMIFFSYEAMIHKWHIVGVWKLSSHPVWFCFIWTVWQLPDDCLMIAWWLPETAWWLLDDCLMNMWWLSDDYLMPAWWLPDDCLMTAWWLKFENQKGHFFLMQKDFAWNSLILITLPHSFSGSYVCVSQAKYKRPWDRTESPKVPDLLHRKGSSTSASPKKKYQIQS